MHTEPGAPPVEPASRLDDLVAEIGGEVEAILRDLSRLHREELGLRARQRLKRAEQGARRIARVLRSILPSPAGDPEGGQATADDEFRQVAADKSEGSLGGAESDDVGGQGG